MFMSLEDFPEDDDYVEDHEVSEHDELFADEECSGDDECLECQRMRIRLIEERLQDLARRGLVCDSGRRRWSERMQSFEIVWVAVPPKEEQH
jgi:hypothetical protein